ncbi:InlB B-repeat-containing protein [Haploplasma axanthum]|uniref:Listeria-Bacteroides repeat domain (List_Bact_rpt) n=1 Tax=Haploplasma axanthum TaxID=29552 RepID=A0A449BF42_HAPAX|nr:InlB B-repeat-containing protein [Haploplasma axanthum]VEU81048.1 Listeria-Bacteroides repeat domain (List_Bact_rpt) [Haploplasma axanthum]
MKKIYLLITIILTLFLITGCKKVEDHAQKYVEQIQITYNGNDSSSSVTNNINLMLKTGSYDINWVSDNDAVSIDKNIGIVKRIDTNVNVKLTAYVTISEKEYNKEFNLIVIKKENKLEYKINFNYNYGDNPEIKEIIVQEGNTIGSITNPTREGYKFVGWMISESEAFDTNQIIDGDLNLFARWIEEKEEIEIFVEDFEFLEAMKNSGNNSSEYMDYEPFIGNSGVEWELVKTRIDLGLKAGGNALTFAGRGNGDGPGVGGIYGREIEKGISYLEFDARLPFSPKSKYPQVPGGDKPANVHVIVKINNEVVKDFQFKDDNEADKGKKIIIDNLNVKGTYSMSIEVSSGHRLTIDNILWKSNPEKNNSDVPFYSIDFETGIDIKEFDTEEVEYDFNGIKYIVQELRVKPEDIHNEKELAYMNESNGNVVGRLRGKGQTTYTAVLYNVNAFEYVSKITFDARLFGSGEYFDHDLNFVVKIIAADGEIIEKIELTEKFKNYEILVDKDNVIIKFEVIGGTINLDNIKYYG